jgi:hypothetical protein
MNFKMTEHYARGEEKLIAAFSELNEATHFLTKKASLNEVERKKIIYRLYDDGELLHELNTENSSSIHAKYAEGNGDFSNAALLTFQVLIKTFDSLEKKTIAQFNDTSDAYLFIVSQFDCNDTVHDNDLFFIVKSNLLIDTVNKSIIEHRNKESGGSNSNESGSSYKLSPLSTRPTPGGGPPDYWVRNEDDDNR